MKQSLAIISSFAQRYPALLVGLLAAGAVIAALERSIVPALIQAACAAVLGCSVKRWH
jgi:hypothetical protein